MHLFLYTGELLNTVQKQALCMMLPRMIQSASSSATAEQLTTASIFILLVMQLPAQAALAN